MIKNNFRILKIPHANLQTIAKDPVKFQKDWPKTVGGVEGTRYLLKIRNHAPRTTHHALRTTHYALRKAENNVPPLFFEKAGDKKPVHAMSLKQRHSALYASRSHISIFELSRQANVCLFVLRLNVPVNNFSVMSGRSHRFLGN